MPPRARLTLALLATLALLLAWVPGTPVFRSWFAGVLRSSASNAGLEIDFSAIEGNAWRGLVLRHPRLRTAGAELQAEQLRLRWFLPSLLVGELPLQVEATGLGGQIRLSEFDLASLGGAGGAPSALRLHLDALRLQGAAIELLDVPFTLPSFTIEQLQASVGEDGGIRAELALRTVEGGLEAVVEGRIGEPELRIELLRGDARIARQWWDGVQGGEVSGSLRWGPSGADGSFDLKDGALTAYGQRVEGVHGPIRWQGSRVETALLGRSLGGTVAAEGGVDWSLPLWWADGEVDVPFGEAGRALLDYLGVGYLPTATEGRVLGGLRFEGWTRATIDGELRVEEGRYLGEPLSSPALGLSYHSDRGGLVVEASGSWGEGPFLLSARPLAGAKRWSFQADALRPLGLPLEAVELQLDVGQQMNGRASARSSSGVHDLGIDLVLDAEGLQAYLNGQLLEGAVEGALASPALRADAPLGGALRWTVEQGAWEGRPQLLAQVGGRLAAPLVDLRLEGEAAVRPALPAGWQLDLDLRGQGEAGWDDRGPWLQGRFGALALGYSGGALQAELLEAVRVEGQGLLARLGPGETSWRPADGLQGELLSEAAWRLGAVDADRPLLALDGPVRWRLSGGPGDWRAESEQGWTLAWGDGPELGAQAAGLLLLDRPMTVSGAWQGQEAWLLASAMDAPLALEGSWSGGRAAARLDSGPQAAQLSWAAEDGLAIAGGLDLGVLGSLWPALPQALAQAEASVQLDGGWRPGEPAPHGQAQLSGQLPWDLSLQATADGLRADLRGSLALPLAPLLLQGAWTPDSPSPWQATAAWGPFEGIAIDQNGASGQGLLPAWQWMGMQVEAQSWSLAVSPALQADLRIEGSTLRYDPANGRAEAAVDLPLRWGDRAGRLAGRAGWDLSQAAPELDLRLDLGHGAEGSLVGTLPTLDLGLHGPAWRWGEALSPALGQEGMATLAGQLRASARWRQDGPSEGRIDWSDDGGGSLLQADLQQVDGALALQAAGDGLLIDLGSTGVLSLQADGFRPEGLLASWPLPLALRLDGRLDWRDGLWSGAMAVHSPDLDAAPELEARLDLSGRGDGFDLDLDARAAGAVLHGQGRLQTSPLGIDMALEASHAQPRAEAAGRLSWDAGRLAVEGVLEVPAGGVAGVDWPAFGLQGEGGFGAQGDGGLDGVWRLQGLGALEGDVEGGMRLPLGSPLGPLELQLAALNPELQLRLLGQDLEASLQGRWAAWALEAAWGEGDESLTLSLLGDGTQAEGGWAVGAKDQAWASGPAQLSGDGLALALPAERLRPERRASLAVGPLLQPQGAVQLTVDASGLHGRGGLSFGLPLLAQAEPWRVDLRLDGLAASLRADGVVAGLRTGVEARSGDLLRLMGQGLELRAELGGQVAEGWLRPTEGGPWRLRMGTEDGAWALDAVAGAAGPSEGRAELRGPGDDQRLQVDWSMRQGAVAAQLQGALYGVDIQAALQQTDGAAAALQLSAGHPASGSRLQLQGPIQPLELRGEMQALGGEPASLALRADPAWQADWGGLRFDLADGGLLLSGSSQEGQLPYLVLDSQGLGWAPASGWSGQARLRSQPLPWQLAASADLAGSGELTADLRLLRAAEPVGGGRLVLQADPTQPLLGELAFDLPLAVGSDGRTGGEAWGQGGGWSLAASGPIGGRISDPQLELALVLTGPRTAHGRLGWADGRARLDLLGQGLTVSGSWRDGAGQGLLELQAVELLDLLPWLDAPVADLRADLRLGAGGPEVWVERLRLATPNGLIEGSGSWQPQEGARGWLRSDMDLQDLALGLDTVGRMEGTLVLASPASGGSGLGQLDGFLTLRDLGVLGVDARIQAEIRAGGELDDPLIQGGWEARGGDLDLSGSLGWRPLSSAFDLLASGRLRGASLDLDLGRQMGGFRGQGRLVDDRGSWSLQADGDELLLQGTAGWAGWGGRLSAEPWRLQMAGDLATLPDMAGRWQADISLGGPAGLGLQLEAEGLDLLGLRLGDLRLTGAPSEGWRLEGSHLNARLSSDLADWQAEVSALPLPWGELLLDASASPSALSARLQGQSPLGAVDLQGGMQAEPPGWRGSLDGLLLGGAFGWPLAFLEGGWSGEGRLDGAQLAGQSFDLAWTLGGGLLDPTLAFEATAEPDLRLSGRYQRSSLTLDAAFGPAADGAVTLRGQAWPELDLLLDTGQAEPLRLSGDWNGGRLRMEGESELRLGAVSLALRAPGVFELRLEGVEGGLLAPLPDGSLTELIATLAGPGLRWSGVGDWQGDLWLRLPASPMLRSDGLRLRYLGLELELRGEADPSLAAFDWVLWTGDLPEALGGSVPERLEGRLRWEGGRLSLDSAGPWRLAASLEPAAREADLEVDLPILDGRLHGRMGLSDRGWQGGLRSDGLNLALAGASASLDLTLGGRGSYLELEADLALPRGVVAMVGRWDAAELLPQGWGLAGPVRREADLRLVGLDLAGLGGASALEGVLGGNAALRGDVLVGQFSVDGLLIGDLSTRASLALQGSLSGEEGPNATVRLDLGSSSMVTEVDGHGIGVFLRLESFPLQELVNAALGPIDVVARVTGVGRASWAWGRLVPEDLRVATEAVHLERAGVVTTGQLAFAWDGEALEIGEALFEGRGVWRARGSATAERLDLELVASEADFDPLLGLIPPFVRYGVSAAGSLRLSAQGTLSDPDINLVSDGLRLGVAGTRYLLDDLSLGLRGGSWSGHASARGVAPLGGQMELSAEGQARLWPSPTLSLEASATGDLEVPLVGRVADLDAHLSWAEGEAGLLQATGLVGGAAASVEGSLNPLDLRLRSQGMRLQLPSLFVAEAVADADLRLLAGDGFLSLSGQIVGSQAEADLGGRSRARAAARSAQVEAGTEEPQPPAAAWERFRFDGVRILVPQRVLVNESFANAEASVDLTLVGTAGTPRLAGTVSTNRGTIRFGGRELDIVQAVLTFDPTTGLFPSMAVETRTTFEKTRVVPPGSEVRFTSPAGPSFSVEVAFAGQSTAGPDGFALDLSPRLSSDALVEGLGGVGARPLSEMELLTLVTLGRLNVDGTLAGNVAQSALDTAIDVLITAELQAALAEALGLQVVELRTSPVSSLISGGDPFGVSLRLGTYLSEEVFASYRLSTLDGGNGSGLTNELLLNYQLGPVAIGLSGRVEMMPNRDNQLGPVPSLSLEARYGFAPGWSLELGVDLSTERSGARLGVTWRW